MKPKFLTPAVLVSILLALFAVAVDYVRGNPELTLVMVASALIWLLNQLFQQGGIKIGKTVLTLLVGISAFAIALILKTPVLPGFPPFTDATTFLLSLYAWASQVLTLLAPVFAEATVFYNVILERILAGLLYVPAFKRFLARTSETFLLRG